MPSATDLEKTHPNDITTSSSVSSWFPPKRPGFIFIGGEGGGAGEADISNEVRGMTSPSSCLTPKLEQWVGVFLRSQGKMGPVPL